MHDLSFHQLYSKLVGTLFGFPQAYYTVDGMTDHAFHYGYFINAAAQVALRDPSFVDEYGNVINELINDVATTKRNAIDSRYPYLRHFDMWEGHSWASGHADFGDGNNQESSSEAINGWAGLILYGQATGNQELTDTGIYLYTTEVNSVGEYWFDYDDDVLSPLYKKTIGGNEHRYASMIWGGKYGYETWWTAEPLQTNGINILPNTAASFYLARNKAYMKDFVRIARENENNYTGQDKDENRWNELYTAYIAMYDPEAAENYFNEICEAEAGDSKAHAYYQIKYMQDKGTPDLTVTGDMPLSAVFKKSGQMTYTVYNPTNADKTVTFSDGTTFIAGKNQLTEFIKEIETTTPDPYAPTTTPAPTTQPPEAGYIKLADGLWYKKIQYEVVGMNPPELLDAGATLQFAFAPAGGTKVYIDDVETPQGTGCVSLVANAIVKLNPKKLPDDSYTNVRIVAGEKTSEVIIKKGSPIPPTTETPSTTEEPTTLAPTTTPEPTTEAPTEEPTVKPTSKPVVTTTYNPRPPQTEPEYPTPVPIIKYPDKAKVKKAIKKKSAKKIKVTLKKAADSKGYQVKVYKSKKKAKKNKSALATKFVTKLKFTFKSKKFKKKKKLFIRARAYVMDGNARIFGDWSKVKKVKVKK